MDQTSQDTHPENQVKSETGSLQQLFPVETRAQSLAKELAYFGIHVTAVAHCENILSWSARCPKAIFIYRVTGKSAAPKMNTRLRNKRMHRQCSS